MTILYSNGCSFTENYNLKDHERYPQILAKQLGYQLIPAALPGSCNRRIIRCTIRDCIKLLKQDQKVFAMVQLSHIARSEFAGIKTEENQWKYVEDDLFESINVPDSKDVSVLARNWYNSQLMLHDAHAEFTRLMSDIIGLTAFFQQHGIDYLIYSGPKIPVDDRARSDTFYQYLRNDPRVLDLIDFNMLDLTGEQKHPDVSGMRLIADYFINLLCESV